ncbi:hypothetical protein JXB28_03415 [Candidatus Woesearchaeota archaeon]|nr:hypothetical protein [Candidatus Woesearchaeota archaeon]
MASSFGNAIGFMGELGVYDVVLPFLMIFTLVFAILEKTKIYGTEKIGGQEYTRKNLNGMTAFVMAFFVVASTRLVAVINEVLASTVLLLLLSVCFLLLAGSFHSGKEEFFLKGGWNKLFMFIMFIGIVLIFLHALGWLDIIWVSLIHNFDSVITSTIVLLVIVVVAIVYITGGFDKKKSGGSKEG